MFLRLQDKILLVVNKYRELSGDPTSAEAIMGTCLTYCMHPHFYLFLSLNDVFKVIGFGIIRVVGDEDAIEMNAWKLYTEQAFNPDMEEGMKFIEDQCRALGIKEITVYSPLNPKIYGRWLRRLGFKTKSYIYSRPVEAKEPVPA